MSLPPVKISSITAALSKAEVTSHPGDFVVAWAKDMIENQGQGELVDVAYEMLGQLLEDPTDKLKALAVLAVCWNALRATVEGKELEELFQESA